MPSCDTAGIVALGQATNEAYSDEVAMALRVGTHAAPTGWPSRAVAAPRPRPCGFLAPLRLRLCLVSCACGLSPPRNRRAMSGRQGGKLKPLKQAKKQTKELDEDVGDVH